MRCKIDSAVIEMFPEVKIGVVIAKEINNQTIHPEISALLRSTEEAIRKQVSPDQLTSLLKIVDWREAYRKFGCKPSSYRSSIEALLRRILQGKELPSINTVVDIYNFISVKHMLPAGGDDIDKVEGDITLTIADGTELFIILGTGKPEKIQKGEIIYRDDKEVLCRAWNYRECEKSKITPITKNICLVLEGLEHTSKEEILKATAELRGFLSSYCKGKIQEFFLDKNHLETSF